MIRRRMRRVVTIQQYTTTRSLSGQAVESWSDVETVRAHVYPVSGKEYFGLADSDSGGKRESTVSTKIIIRYRPDVTTGMRVVDGSTVYDIKAVLGGEDSRRQLMLMCERSS